MENNLQVQASKVCVRGEDFQVPVEHQGCTN